MNILITLFYGIIFSAYMVESEILMLSSCWLVNSEKEFSSCFFSLFVSLISRLFRYNKKKKSKNKITIDERNIRNLNRYVLNLSKITGSLFNGKYLLKGAYRNELIKMLRNEIKNLNPDFYDDIRILFAKRSNYESYMNKNILSSRKKYPFNSLNQWIRSYINAVDKDIHGKNSKNDWKIVKENYLRAYEDCKNTIGIRMSELPKHKSNGWFYGDAGNYKINTENFNEYAWENIVKRANGKNGYSDFKMNALSCILSELYT